MAFTAAPVAARQQPDDGRTDVARLVVAARAGDRAAFGELYVRFGRMVQGIVLSRVASADADDIVHDVFLTAMQRLDALEEPLAFGSWVATIARNRALDFLRRTPRAEALPPRLFAPGDASRQSEVIAVYAALRTLPEQYRETLTMRLVMGMTGPEIAETTAMTPGAVRVNLHRGMRMLRDRLDGRAV